MGNFITRVPIISTSLLLLWLLTVATQAQTKSVNHAKNETLTKTEIKEAERIFATFKKRLEDTNDVRIALRGIPANNWFKNLYLANVWGLDQIIPLNNPIVLRNIKVYRQFYLNLLTVSRIIGLHTATFSKGSDEDSDEMSHAALVSVLRKAPSKDKKSIQFSWAAIEGDLKFNTNLKKVIQATRMFNTAIGIVGKDLLRLRHERPSDYLKALQQINIYNSEAPLEGICNTDGYYGLKKGTNYLSIIESGYSLMVGRVNNRIGIFAVEIYSP